MKHLRCVQSVLINQVSADKPGVLMSPENEKKALRGRPKKETVRGSSKLTIQIDDNWLALIDAYAATRGKGDRVARRATVVMDALKVFFDLAPRLEESADREAQRQADQAETLAHLRTVTRWMADIEAASEPTPEDIPSSSNSRSRAAEISDDQF